MGLVDVTVQVPQGTNALLNVVVDVVKDVKAKDYTSILDDLLQAVKSYESFADLQADFKQPEVAIAIGLGLGQIGALFITKAAAASLAKSEQEKLEASQVKPA